MVSLCVEPVVEVVEKVVTYKRDIAHCEKSPYVSVVTVKTVSPAPNADNLEYLDFNEVGYRVLSQKARYGVGDRLFLCPAESVLPFELSEKLEVTKYLSSGRVKAIKLRGNRTEGLVMPVEMGEEWAPYIMKWEDKPVFHCAIVGGGSERDEDIPVGFSEFYKIPNIKNEPNLFRVGEPIYYSEKAHGTSWRAGVYDIPRWDKGVMGVIRKVLKFCGYPIKTKRLYVGSHHRVLRSRQSTWHDSGFLSKNTYWKIASKYLEGKEEILPVGWEIFGEIYGPGIQDITYGLTEPDLRVFAMKKSEGYMDPSAVRNTCLTLGLPCMDFHETVFESVDQLIKLSEEKSELDPAGLREGIVVVSKEYAGRMAKVISFNYLERKNGTERH
jgi:RNA ligase (TIGR02306 family)